MKKLFNINTFAEFLLIFFTGAVIYYSIEVIWRGYSHIAMALLGGICFLLLYLIGRFFPKIPTLFYCILGGIIITLLELVTGEILNNALGLDIWDYSSVPLNFRGQICLLFSFFWCLISYPAFFLSKLMRMKIFGLQK
ncbi:MAG: hypothetical protein IKJ91_04050 [Clostridia bacterium]|nr:hypothetical protein [Clostridia bacterium]